MNVTAEQQPPAEDAAFAEMLILAVDDKLTNLVALERALSGIPARLIKATSGEEALAASLQHQFALAILDVQMPGMDGFELAEILLGDPATSRTPIIFVTAAYADEQHRFKGYDAGAVDYMVKPYDPAILRSKVKVFLELARHRLGLEGIIDERTSALRASEARYRTLFETMAQGVVYQEASGRIVDANPAAARILGVPLAQMLGRQSVDPEWKALREDGTDFPGTEHPAMVALRTGRPVDAVVMGLRRADDGKLVWIQVSAIPQFRPGEARPYQVYATFSDITARREAEQKVADSERALRAIFDGTKDGIFAVDAETLAFQFGNDAMTRMVGRSREGMLALTLPEILPAEQLKRVVDRFRGSQRSMHQVLDLPLTRTGGGELYVDAALAPIELRGRRCMLGVFRDMSERREEELARQRLQTELFRAQKMESIGALAGGVAHDFNNLLSVVLGYLCVALEDDSLTDETRADLIEVRKAGERSAELTRQLLAFGRKQVMQRVPLDLNHVAVGVEKMLRRIIGEDVDLSMQLGAELGVVSADPGQLEQVIVNLAVNARDAMPKGGMLVFGTSNAVVPEGEGQGADVPPPGAYVRLRMTDSGSGMDEATLARIFEPFFTTKEKGKGTGLGLSTVYGIVKQSGGFVQVRTELGKGTTFDVLLPRIEEVATTTIGAQELHTEARGGDETILVVEDAAPVRALVARALGAAGYRVLLAEDGVDALRVNAAHEGPLHLVLTDLVMPRMNGEELVAQLGPLRPGLRALYMSGYTESVVQAQGLLDPATNFIEKPLRIAELLKKVRVKLDRTIQASSATT